MGMFAHICGVCLAVMAVEVQAGSVGFDYLAYRGVDSVAPAAGEYRNPILAGFYPDPTICRAGDDYYLVNSTFEYFPGLPIFHSTDLVNWTQIGNVIHRPEQLNYHADRMSAGLYAPAISYHEGTFYVICTMIEGPGNFLVTATDPAGPWSDPVPLAFSGIDPSLFFDDDGRVWVVNNDDPDGQPLYQGHRAVRIQEYDSAAKKMIGPRKVIVNGGVDLSKKPIWIEGPHLYKRNDWYYLCCAEGGTWTDHSQVIFRSKTVDGLYVPWEKNPILTQRGLDGNESGAVTCAGHVDLEIGPDGNWWAVFLGMRPYADGLSPMGRETFMLPVTWTEDDWPVILPPGKRVPLTVKAPMGSTVKSGGTPMNGSFSWREEFDAAELGLEWLMVREPNKSWWKLSGGRLEIEPQALNLYSGTENPSYAGRRIQHHTYTVGTELSVPSDDNVSAGLALLMNEKYHYFFAVKRDQLYLERVEGGQVEIIASAERNGAGPVALKIEADKALCSFLYREAGGEWNTLVKDADAKIITSNVPGGSTMFIGATAGPHVRVDAAASFAGSEYDFVLKGNPVFRDTWTADPATLVVGDTLYVYVGHDDAHGDQMFNMPEWLCYSTKDMKHWTAHGTIMKPTDFKWAVKDAWAAQVVEKDGKFYFYATVHHDSTHSGKAIGVAVADSPLGPFEDARGSALITEQDTPSPNGWDDIDPTVLVDDDGTAWLAWGNPNCYLAKLKPSMTEIDGEIQKIHLPNYTEGPWFYKRDQRYYLFYPAFAHQGSAEKICYATADDIAGPWTYQGILTGSAQGSYTIHPAVVDFKGQTYFFYHNAALELNGEAGAIGRRAVCAEYLYFNNDGTIQPIEQTTEGIAIPPSGRGAKKSESSIWQQSDAGITVTQQLAADPECWQGEPAICSVENPYRKATKAQSFNGPGWPPNIAQSFRCGNDRTLTRVVLYAGDGVGATVAEPLMLALYDLGIESISPESYASKGNMLGDNGGLKLAYTPQPDGFLQIDFSLPEPLLLKKGHLYVLELQGKSGSSPLFWYRGTQDVYADGAAYANRSLLRDGQNSCDFAVAIYGVPCGEKTGEDAQ